MSELFRLYLDAVRDSYAAAYSLLIVAPLTLLASSVLLYRGKKTTRLQVYLVSLVVPMLAVCLPMWYLPEETNVYRVLMMGRHETPYQWSQKYVFYRKQFQSGSMSIESWNKIDSAYDKIYSEKSRYLYDFWGPGQEEMSVYETHGNVGLFYLLWFAIIYAVTTPKAAQAASKVSFVGLIALLCIELTVRLTRYDPAIKELSPFITPREYLLWGHRIFPILVFAAVLMTKTFFIDLEKHHQRVLIYMLEKNKETAKELQLINQALTPEVEVDETLQKRKK
ncbi:unnamed protein product [Peronospora destructor]|uniref:Uncharacterized protein n=1 Tax=Peronospora destructor TaxID=86335 RepID=A0AAV0VBC8_9STRA|nr:unnamed protein product [Peronospora destructor]